MKNTKKQEIKKKLKEISDKKYQDFHSSLCPGTENIIGVRVPILRNYAKELFKEKDWKQTIKEIDNEYYEEIMLKGMLIGQAKTEDINIILKYVEEYVPHIDNWAICDVFCAGLKITKKYKKEMWNVIQKYLKSDKEFEIRFAIVMILDYYIEEEYLKENFEIFEKIKCDEYYVKMAVAWAISICLIKFYSVTIEYMKTSKIDSWTYNKAIQKAIESYRITEENKKILREMKKKL
ncbi:MAG: DNA alkylation repair protein [Clostridia bacterium]|nr:DNA alkylation repair protein [Clostridia bacterium]